MDLNFCGMKLSWIVSVHENCDSEVLQKLWSIWYVNRNHIKSGCALFCLPLGNPECIQVDTASLSPSVSTLLAPEIQQITIHSVHCVLKGIRVI